MTYWESKVLVHYKTIVVPCGPIGFIIIPMKTSQIRTDETSCFNTTARPTTWHDSITNMSVWQIHT